MLSMDYEQIGRAFCKAYGIVAVRKDINGKWPYWWLEEVSDSYGYKQWPSEIFHGYPDMNAETEGELYAGCGRLVQRYVDVLKAVAQVANLGAQ